MDNGKKGLALLILEHAKKKGMGNLASSMKDDSMEETDEGEEDAGKLSAMEDFITAVKGDDAKAALEAYTSLCELHEG